MNTRYASVEEAVEDIRNGRMLIVVDDQDRENEGDLVMAAEKVTPEAVNFMARNARGLLCQAITPERARELDLKAMVPANTSLHGTAFTVSVDAKKGTTTGISAFDRAATVKAIIDPATEPEDLLRPGHVFPLVAKEGGVLSRRGHTETAADLAALAGLAPSGILCEILDDDGTMARLPRLERLAEEFDLRIVTVEDLVRWRTEKEASLVRREAESSLATEEGNFRVYVYDNPRNADMPHLALVSEKAFDKDKALVRVHSECFTGETLFSRRCDCGPQLRTAMRRIAEEGGVLVYLRQEGRGIGLAQKIRAYALQDAGFDTYEANVHLGFRPDERDFSVAAGILKDLGVTGIRLMTNNPEKIEALKSSGIGIVERVGLEMKPTKANRDYLAAKKSRFGHLLEYV